MRLEMNGALANAVAVTPAEMKSATSVDRALVPYMPVRENEVPINCWNLGNTVSFLKRRL